MRRHSAITLPELRTIANCYTFGYPLVLSGIAAQLVPGRAVNQLLPFHDDALERSVGPGGHIVSSLAWLDISAQPMLLRIPTDHRRYYAISIADAWTNMLTSISPRVTETVPQGFAIVKCGYDASKIPAGWTPIASPTSLVRMMLRIGAYSDADLPSALEFQRRVRLVALNDFLAGTDALPSIEQVHAGQQAAVACVDAMSGAEFFAMLTTLLRANPPTRLDAGICDALTLIDCNADAVEGGARLAKTRIQSYRPEPMRLGTWFVDFTCEPFAARDYVRRAAVARSRLYTDVAQDYFRVIADRDASDLPLNGRFNYTLTFDRWSEPAARGPWFVGTIPPLRKRGTTIPRDACGAIAFRFEGLSAEDPDDAGLPVPTGPFSAVLHVFWPQESILKGGWLPPDVEREA